VAVFAFAEAEWLLVFAVKTDELSRLRLYSPLSGIVSSQRPVFVGPRGAHLTTFESRRRRHTRHSLPFRQLFQQPAREAIPDIGLGKYHPVSIPINTSDTGEVAMVGVWGLSNGAGNERAFLSHRLGLDRRALSLRIGGRPFESYRSAMCRVVQNSTWLIPYSCLRGAVMPYSPLGARRSALVACRDVQRGAAPWRARPQEPPGLGDSANER
jgi:hypothetical protein